MRSSKNISNRTLRCCAAFLLLLAFTTSNAATVLIDFEEVTPVYSVDPITLESKGYTFNTAVVTTVQPENNVDVNGIYAYAESGFTCSICYATITMEKTDGNGFSILSLESFGNGSFSGGVVGGGGADLSVAVGTGDWLNLQSLELSSFGGGAFSVYEVQMDNIVVSGVVPIPAAVWLFGSALAGLGWIRRQRKA